MKALLVLVILNTYSGDNTGLTSQMIHMKDMDTCWKVADSINDYDFQNRKLKAKAHKEAFCVTNDDTQIKTAASRVKASVKKQAKKEVTKPKEEKVTEVVEVKTEESTKSEIESN